MCRKKHLGLLLQRSVLNLKALRKAAFIPVALADVLLPILLAVSFKRYGTGEHFLLDVKNYCFMLLPAAVSFASIFSMKNYVGEIGEEVLYVCRNRVKILDFAVLLLLGSVNTVIPGALICFVTTEAIPVLIAVMCVSVFLVGLSYFLLYVTKSLTAVIMTALLYVIISLMLGGYYTVFPFYVISDTVTYSAVLRFYVPILIFGVVFSFFGIIKNRKSFIH